MLSVTHTNVGRTEGGGRDGTFNNLDVPSLDHKIVPPISLFWNQSEGEYRSPQPWFSVPLYTNQKASFNLPTSVSLSKLDFSPSFLLWQHKTLNPLPFRIIYLLQCLSYTIVCVTWPSTPTNFVQLRTCLLTPSTCSCARICCEPCPSTMVRKFSFRRLLSICRTFLPHFR